MRKTTEMESFGFRALITDTLPYEVPVTFSNDRLFRTMGRGIEDEGLQKVLAKLNVGSRGFTIPYQYNIRKSRTSSTRLSIVHPQTQLLFSEFYNAHSDAILEACSRSRFSLRRPAGVAQSYADFIKDDSAKQKAGVVQLEVNRDEGDISHVISYFSYAGYNLLGKFFESKEFLSLEKTFARMRSLDVSKCFFNIYTHSVTWAVKSKDYSKKNRKSYSFESNFDQVMQWSNYNETNGIVIGPEFSRVFAEVILQAIDRSVLNKLTQQNLHDGVDYSVRRYVDDFYIFANKDEDLDRIERVLRSELEEYKLFVNEKKRTTTSRPFVSKLSMARSEMHAIIRDLWSIFGTEKEISIESGIRRRDSLIKDIQKIRFIIAKFDIEFTNISGYLLTAIRNLVRTTVFSWPKDAEQKVVESTFRLLKALLETTFYICALDMRVRATYSACQIIMFARDVLVKIPDEFAEQLIRLLVEELSSLVRTALSRVNWEQSQKDSVELFNLLICGALFVGNDFLQLSVVREAMDRIVADKPTYFGLTTVKFCALKDPEQANLLVQINDLFRERILADPSAWIREAEVYLLLCDYLGSPDIEAGDKREVCNIVLKGDVSKKTAALFGEHIGFTDWSGASVDHILRRKELRPAYG